MQRQSVKERLEAWPIKQIASPDSNAKLSINAEESDSGDLFSIQGPQESSPVDTAKGNQKSALAEERAERYPIGDFNSQP